MAVMYIHDGLEKQTCLLLNVLRTDVVLKVLCF